MFTLFFMQNKDCYLKLVLDRVVFRSSHEVAMVAALLQFHHDVDEARHTSLDAFRQLAIVLGENPLVVLLLHLRHLDSQNLFGLSRQRLFDVLLDAT